MRDDDTAVRIALPLPLDIAGTITRLFAVAYPGGTIDTRPGRELVLRVPDSDRQHPRGGKRALAAAKMTTQDPAQEPSMVGWHDNGPIFSTPADASLALAAACAAMLDDELAINYMEAECEDSEGTRYVVVACRSHEQTPHALRQKAEAEAAMYRQIITKLISDESSVYVDLDESELLVDGRIDLTPTEHTALQQLMEASSSDGS